MQEAMENPTQSTGVEVPLLEKVRRQVINGRYGPGDLIPEIVLAEEFGVSRTPIREVLKQLQNEGLVEIRPRVGTFVREPTRREIVELFELKESLEGLAASLMARRGRVPELETLERNLEASDVAASEGNSQSYAELVHEFHWTLVRGADNRKLYETYERLMNQLAYHRIVVDTVTRPGRLKASDNEHHAVVEAINRKDALDAEFTMRNHVRASSQAALAPTDYPRLTEAGALDNTEEHSPTVRSSRHGC
ncbi:MULTISPECIES: GntR family transcriptional regulator [Micrococcaceae]|uniref:GntR family transcriptional regulator n=1 Tax=unclassified Kocuria TaxID=2649579 RepID=UPI001012A7D2|nr:MULTISPECIES: GntR family transcriptional regulator [unclassified Kocuria]